MRILSLNYETALGSVIHATPMFAALRHLHPNWEVHVACAGMPAEILHRNPSIGVIHHTASPINATLRAAFQFIIIGRQYKYDALLLNSGNSRSRIAWNGCFIDSKVRIGVSAKSRFLDISYGMQEGRSVAANNLQVLKPIIANFDEIRYAEAFEVFWGPAERDRAIAFRRNLLSDRRPLIGFVTQTSGGQPSEWWDERFCTVATTLNGLNGAVMAFFGSLEQQERITAIQRRVGANAISLAGQTTLGELGALCAACDLLISLDTGTMHIGRAVGVPMVVIAPAWQPAWEWLPINQEKIKVLRRWDIGCRHCRKTHCASHECMDEISAAEVITAALDQLMRFSSSNGQWLERVERWVRVKQQDHGIPRKHRVSTV